MLNQRIAVAEEIDPDVDHFLHQVRGLVQMTEMHLGDGHVVDAGGDQVAIPGLAGLDQGGTVELLSPGRVALAVLRERAAGDQGLAQALRLGRGHSRQHFVAAIQGPFGFGEARSQDLDLGEIPVGGRQLL